MVYEIGNEKEEFGSGSKIIPAIKKILMIRING